MGKAFKFSVLMPVYNVEKYLVEAIDSLISQSIGFEENIELIIVDDGSPDNSKEIALEYQESYPENIKVFSKENGGQASAFNLGLKYLRGEYVSFLDSDDYLSSNTLEEVYAFFEEHGEEIDIVSIPMIYFENRTDSHFLNYKYSSTRVIDLIEKPWNPQLSIASSFIRRGALEGFEFDTVLPHGYDALVVNKILLERKKLGVVDSAIYHYRDRRDNSSMIDNAYKKKEYYTYLLKNLYFNLIEYSKEKDGCVPKFIQYMMAYNIQWYDKVSDFPDFLKEEEVEEFMEALYEILDHIDEDVLNDSKIIKRNYLRYFLIYLKNRKEFHIDVLEEEGEVYLKTGDFIINNLHNHGIYLDSIMIENGILKISGTFTSSCDYDKLEFEAIKTVSGVEKLYKESEDESRLLMSNVKRFLGADWHFKRYFGFEIPLEEEESSIRLNIIYSENGHRVIMNNAVKFRETSLLADRINYFVVDSNILTFKENSFHICPYSSEKALELKQELLTYIKEILESEKNLKKDNRALNKEINKLERKNKKLEQRNDSLNMKNNSLNRKNESLMNKNEKLMESLQKSKDKNEEILNSTSWKITKPLRMPKQILDKRK